MAPGCRQTTHLFFDASLIGICFDLKVEKPNLKVGVRPDSQLEVETAVGVEAGGKEGIVAVVAGGNEGLFHTVLVLAKIMRALGSQIHLEQPHHKKRSTNRAIMSSTGTPNIISADAVVHCIHTLTCARDVGRGKIRWEIRVENLRALADAAC